MSYHRGRGIGEKGRGTNRDRSPEQLREIRGVRRRLAGDDLGSIFGSLSEVMKREMETVVGNAPRDIQATMKAGMNIMVKAVEEAMGKITERNWREGEQMKERERRLQEQMGKLEEKVLVLEKEAEVCSTQLEEKVKRVEEKLIEGMEKVRGIEEKMEEVEGHVELVSDVTLGLKVAESVKQMEEKVREASLALKVVNMDLGLETENKAIIVRKVLGEVRRKVRQEDAGQVDRVLRRTRVVVLGKRTEGRKVGERTIWTVPILFECLDKKDAEDLEWCLRGGGVFPTVHWPDEIMDFITSIKREVREGSSGQGSWIKVRPVEGVGQVRIRVETKFNGVGRFRVRGEWACPPLKKELWTEVKGLFDPIRG